MFLLCNEDYTKAFDCVDHNKLWKILQEMGIPDHLTCLLRNLYAVQEATVRTGHGTTDWMQIGKGVRQGCYFSLCLFNLYAEYIMRNARLDEAQAGIKIAGRNISTRPGPLFEGNPVGEGTTRRGTDPLMHLTEKTEGSTHSSTNGLLSCEIGRAHV